MHIYFSGIGGTGIGPLALIAQQADFEVTGSDKQNSSYIEYLKKHGVKTIHIGQDYESIAALHARHPIDWFVYSSALPKENPNHPELEFVKAHGVKHSKRDEFLSYLLQKKDLKMIAIAGTHGKTTTTAMAVWLFKLLGIPISYSVGAKISFGEMGEYDPASKYFVYECDEYDRNFLAYHPTLSLITGIDWDHADIYPTREEYYEAFRQFLAQSEKQIIWSEDAQRLSTKDIGHTKVLDEKDPLIDAIELSGEVNRRDAFLAVSGLSELGLGSSQQMIKKINNFPGLSRRFEQLIHNLYTDYAHTPGKIKGALQLAHEIAGDNVVVVYEGLHNTRQHFIKDDMAHLFDSAKQLYIVPSYLAREDPNLQLLTPADIVNLTSHPDKSHPSALDDTLKNSIEQHLRNGDLVLCLSAGGGGSLDEWLRRKFLNG